MGQTITTSEMLCAFSALHSTTYPVLSSVPQSTLYLRRCKQYSWQSIPSTDPLAFGKQGVEGHIQYQGAASCTGSYTIQWPSDSVKGDVREIFSWRGQSRQSREVLQLCDLRVGQQGTQHRAPSPAQ